MLDRPQTVASPRSCLQWENVAMQSRADVGAAPTVATRRRRRHLPAKSVVVGISQELVEDGMFFFEGLGDTVIRNRQGDEHGAVLFDDRQEFLSLFRFTGNGIDQGRPG